VKKTAMGALIGSIYSRYFDCMLPLFAEAYRLLRVHQAKEAVAVRV